jgi:hypothetical protein
MDHTEQGVPLNFRAFQGLSVQLMFEKAKGRKLKETKNVFSISIPVFTKQCLCAQNVRGNFSTEHI